MSSLAGILLRPVVEPLLKRLDHWVTPEEHVELAVLLVSGDVELGEPADAPGDASSPAALVYRSLLHTAKAWVHELDGSRQSDLSDEQALWSAALKITNFDEAGHVPGFETSTQMQLIRLLCLADNVASQYRGAAEFAEWVSVLSDRASWGEPGPPLAAARCASAAICGGLRCGTVSASAAAGLLSDLTEDLAAGSWFPARGPLYGTSYLLRALIACVDPCSSDVRGDYVHDVCESLLRHVETKRDSALAFQPGSTPAGGSRLLERLSFTHAVLDAARAFGDIRYLSAGLKLNDWHYKTVGKIALERGLGRHEPESVMVALHYAASVVYQERLFSELVDQ